MKLTTQCSYIHNHFWLKPISLTTKLDLILSKVKDTFFFILCIIMSVCYFVVTNQLDGNIRITTNPAEMFSEQFRDKQENCDEGSLNCLQQIDDQNMALSEPNTSLGVLIPPNHKSTRIVPSTILALGSPDTPPPPIPPRTRHIPIPSKQNICSDTDRHSLLLTRASFEDKCHRKDVSKCVPPIPPHQITFEKSSINGTLQENSRSLLMDCGITRNQSNPPPIPPHRIKTQLKPSTITASTSSPKPMRPQNLMLNHSNLSEPSMSTKMDYRRMMKLLDRLKETDT